MASSIPGKSEPKTDRDAEAEKSTEREVHTVSSPEDIAATDIDVTATSLEAPPRLAIAPDSGDDTMLSAPAPAELAADLEQRLLRAEREITRLTARIETLEARKPIEVVQASGNRSALALWILALGVLVVTWVVLGPGTR